ALVIIGVLISLFYPVSWWLSSIVRSFGEALAVGSVIVILLERFVSHRLIQETADELSGKLVGFRLPKDLQKKIGEIVQNTSFVCDHSSIRYDIRKDPRNQKQVIVTIERRYRVKNYGRKQEKFRPTLSEEKFHNPQFLSLDCSYGNDQSYTFDNSKIKVHESPGSQIQNFKGTPVRLEPFQQGISDYEPCIVTWKYSITTPCNYSDVIAFRWSTVSPFTISRGEIPEDFEFVPSRGEKTVGSEDGTVWHYNHPFLPGEHIRVWWRPVQT
ncbi:MAG TPA: hypothetical protein VJ044_15225, partial [Candidatus Hodarchaeales archaeon]|nr:hypothetical protein [Candidatus Hodarchaeales archaeon]